MQHLQRAANTIRGLAMDGVERAKSGHPGMPMGTADFAVTLFLQHLKYDPSDPAWPDRDRFVLSAGHGSMLLYSLLHLAGYDISLDDLRNFRQLGSRTPGHPERGVTPGVETTTGPLGQGCGNAVGMAIAEAMLAARFNQEDMVVVDHRTFVLAGDGDMMEGVSHEAFSLAGHLGLNKLIVFYDFNRITIEGRTDLAYSDDVRRRFEGYHWNVLEIDGHDFRQISEALDAAVSSSDRPTLIIGHTHIAHGAPNAHDTAEAHGAPLGPAEVRAAKAALGLPPDQEFFVPEDVRDLFARRRAENQARHEEWNRLWKRYQKAHPDLASAWNEAMEGRLPPDLAEHLPPFDPSKPMATRSASGAVLQSLAKVLPFLVGGSADLAPSTNTYLKGFDSVGPHSFRGRNFHFGVREHAMAAAMNGMALHGGFRVFGATFCVFADYMRPSVRMAALMGLPVVYVFTHDSIFVGEDGPTHQPVEHAASLRVIPGLTVIRPADATETAAAWEIALRRTQGPTALLLTRQTVPVLDRAQYPPARNVEHGAYILWESCPGTLPRLMILASGSEVALALEAGRRLAAEESLAVRVVSFPSWELFERQTKKYRTSVLPPGCRRRVAVEAGVSMGWGRYVRPSGRVISVDRFGASGPYRELAAHFGFTAEHVMEVARSLLR